MPDVLLDETALSMTEIIRLQNRLSRELTRRFERRMALAFSDIVGSTPYFARFGDEAGRRLQQSHVDLLNECLHSRAGRIVDTAGDGAFMAFTGADDAVEAVIEFGEAVSRHNLTRPREQQLHVRIGLHWGSVLTDEVVVTGDAVNLCARVAGSAETGETRLTRELFHEVSPAHRLQCRGLGRVELKGISGGVELLALEWRDPGRFPTTVRLEELRREAVLPSLDIISFGRLREQDETQANHVILELPDPAQNRQISRWHFELRRHPDGFRLRSVSEGGTEVDGQSVVRGQEVPVRPGTTVRVAKVLTLTFLSSPSPALLTNQEPTVTVED